MCMYMCVRSCIDLLISKWYYVIVMYMHMSLKMYISIFVYHVWPFPLSDNLPFDRSALFQILNGSDFWIFSVVLSYIHIYIYTYIVYIYIYSIYMYIYIYIKCFGFTCRLVLVVYIYIYMYVCVRWFIDLLVFKW